MPTYKLHYFNVRGRAETSRMMFKLQGQQFEDIRYDITTDWQTKKAGLCSCHRKRDARWMLTLFKGT